MAYKVIDKVTRRGTNASIAMTEYGFDESVFDEVAPEYYPKYIAGTVVKAVEGSAGICCFKTQSAAQEFIGLFPKYKSCKFMIVKVRGWKKVKSPVLKVGLGCLPCVFKRNLLHCFERPIPRGFVSFEKVKVLE